MALLQKLPHSLCQAGPADIDGVGNYYLQILDQPSPRHSVLDLYLLDSHEQIPSDIQDPDYDPIKISQIEWFKDKSRALRKERERNETPGRFHASLAFLHIPLPEFGDELWILRAAIAESQQKVLA